LFYINDEEVFLKKIMILTLLLFISNLMASEKVSLQLKWKHSFQFAGFYMAKEKGFYRDAGLDVSFKELDNKTDLVSSVVSGASNYGVGDSALVLYKLKKSPIVLMMPIFNKTPLALLTTRDIVALDAFKQDKITINAFSLQSPAILSMLYLSNVDYVRLK